jgi:hypothetical protein
VEHARFLQRPFKNRPFFRFLGVKLPIFRSPESSDVRATARTVPSPLRRGVGVAARWRRGGGAVAARWRRGGGAVAFMAGGAGNTGAAAWEGDSSASQGFAPRDGQR